MYLSKRVLIISCAFLTAFRLLEDAYDAGLQYDKTTLLVIGVLSAQNHTAARNSIRNTWKALTKSPDITFFFLVGNDFCPFHPIDRKSELSCEVLDLHSHSEDPLWTPDILKYEERNSKLLITSFTFRVNFPVIVRGVRVWRGAVSSLMSAAVTLKNARTGNLIKTISNLNEEAVSRDASSWIEINFKPYLLPKSFDVEVQFIADIEHKDVRPILGPSSCYGLSSWSNFSGGVEFTSLYSPDIGWINFDEESCSPVSLLLELHGWYFHHVTTQPSTHSLSFTKSFAYVIDLTTHLKERETRSMLWQKQMRTQTDNLKDEAFIEKDILLLDVLDVYRNIPKKLLEFYKWCQNNINFSFILKSDDDTFVNVPLIENYLKYVEDVEQFRYINSPLWWWGKLRHGLPVERFGKWQELQYAAPVYPPFPCGSGYVLNRNIVKFLVNNSEWLHQFQGEDTSLGIWLSGISPEAPKNAVCEWTCATECDKRSCNRGQLSVDGMLSVWKQYQESGRLC